MASPRGSVDERSRAQLAQAPYGESIGFLKGRQIVLVDGCDADLIAALVQLEGHRPCLTLDAADERRIVIAGDEQAHRIRPLRRAGSPDGTPSPARRRGTS